jgi:hypothetical protein
MSDKIENNLEIEIEDIESIECLGMFQNEYVYDIEVDDTHTFFANDILVHNSIYVELNRIVQQLNIPPERELAFTVDLWNYGLEPYMNQKYEDYAKAFNCNKNLQKLELEKIATSAVMVAKKHYTMMEGWKEPNIYLDKGEDIIYKGLELIQGSCPKFVRECQADFYKRVLMWYGDHNTPMGFTELFAALKKYKADFIKQNPDDISKGASIGDYEKFVLDDTNQVALNLHCPIHVKGAAIANYFLNKPENKKFRAKYNRIKTRDKVKFYKTTDPNYPVFAFLPGDFPLEYAPPIDYNQQFEDLILTPLNKVLAILNHPQLTPELCFTSALF